jgi:hypothetical protein
MEAVNGEVDRTRATLVSVAVITFANIVFFITLDIDVLVAQASNSFQIQSDYTILLAVFRTGCFLLAVYTIIFWMIRNPVPGRMFVTTHDTNESVMLRITGFERITTFSSWTLMAFGTAFFFAGVATWLEVFDRPTPSFLSSATVVLMPIAYGSAFLTATVVRYIIIPEEVAKERPFGNFFLNYELVMHNYTAIFLAVDLFFVQATLRWEFAIFPAFFGIIYALFSYGYARMKNGYYIYDFLDPRKKEAPMYAFVLLIACSLFYFGLWLVSLLLQWNMWVGGLVLALWVSRIVLFRRGMRDNPYAHQSRP